MLTAQSSSFLPWQQALCQRLSSQLRGTEAPARSACLAKSLPLLEALLYPQICLFHASHPVSCWHGRALDHLNILVPSIVS
jgi:hypothetical protein